MDESYRVEVRVFEAGTSTELARLVNEFLARISAAYVRAVHYQAVGQPGAGTGWGWSALVEYEARW